MTDLYQINEILNSNASKEKKDSQSYYPSDASHLSTINLFVKAVQKTLEKIKDAMEALGKVKNPHGTAAERELEDAKLLVQFSESLALAGKIIDEFQRGTSILYDETPELVTLFGRLNDSFTAVRAKISLLAIKKEKKYADEAIETLNIILELFQNMKDAIQSDGSSSSQSEISETST